MNFKRIYTRFLVLILSISFSYLYGQSADYVPGQVLVKLKQGKSEKQRSLFRSQVNATVLKTFPQLDVELWKIDGAQSKADISSFIRQYQKHPDVDYIEPDYIVSVGATTPNDPFYGDLWGQHNIGQNGGTPDADIDAPEAWDIATESPDVVVAIIDTGIDWAHEDLVDNIWHNLGEDADGDGSVLEWNGTTWIFDPGDENNIDDDGNGYIDDFVGWDFKNNDNDPFDDRYHGTHVAGTIGASGNNNIGVVGVTWKVQLAALKFLSDRGSGTTSDAIVALNYAVSMGMPISNNSWGGGGYSATLYEALQNAEASGHLFFSSAGNKTRDNDKIPHYPSNYPNDNVISVASMTRTDQLSSFSNKGMTTVDLGAPGSSIYSCFPLNEYNTLSGTSMATPQVAGACALLWGQHPNRTAAEIKNALLNSTDYVPILNGKCLSEGRLNLYKAMTYFDYIPPASCRANDSLALVALYTLADGMNWTTSWDLTQSMNTWHGVTLNAGGCVSELNVSDNNLSGYLPSEISTLSELIYLNLSDNNLTGGIPSAYNKLTNLNHLILTKNSLSGTISSALGSLGNLIELDLSRNRFSGSIPSSFRNLSSLSQLKLANNNLSGSLPSGLGDLQNLTVLTVNYNDLKGCYDPNLLQLCTQLDPLYNTNSHISTGNNLYGTWENLCMTGIGVCIDCRPIDSLALVSLYNAIDGENWRYPWDLNMSMENWWGVTLNDIGCVTKLNLGNQLLIGHIPQSISDISYLEYLNLSNNQLSGPIPPELGELIYIDFLLLQNNELSGQIPSSIGNMYNLYYLNLMSNQLSGSIPKELGDLNNLSRMHVANNQLSGCYDSNLMSRCTRYNENAKISEGNNFDAAWDDFCDTGVGGCMPLTCRTIDSLALVSLYQSTNGANWTDSWNLSQPIDSWYGVTLNAEGCVSCLDLDGDDDCENDVHNTGNGLVGSLPAEIGNLSQLTFLDLSANDLTGTLPSTIGNLEMLTYLNLWRNALNGSIPSPIGNLENLSYLNLGSNDFSGAIPDQIGFLDQLVVLSLELNNLSGTLPSSFSNLEKLDYLYLSKNRLSGNIESVSNLPFLKYIDLSSNQFSGPIPTGFGYLNRLSHLYANNNQLTGQLPYEFGTSTTLKVIRLQNNQLTGNIPVELANMSSLGRLKIHDNQLSGCYDENLSALCTQLSSTYNNNASISQGNNFDAPWESFCTTGAGRCTDETLVWPGDFNADGKADNVDVLYWGLAETNTGPIRPNASTDWIGQASPDWSISVDGINGKHQDADGNGIVNIQDLQSLIDNYGRISELSYEPNSAPTVEFRLESISHSTTGPITTLEYALYAEQNGAPAEIHGASCSIIFNDFNVISAGINTTLSSLDPDEKIDISNGNTLDIALTRTDGNDQICATPIATIIAFVATENFTDAQSFSLSTTDGKMLKANGTISAAYANTFYDEHSEIDADNNNMFLNATVEHVECLTAGSAEIHISGGMGNYNIQWNTGAVTEQINDLSPGTYTVTVSDSNGLSNSLSVEVEGQYLPTYDDNGNLISCLDFTCPTVIDFIGNIPDGTHHASQAINTNAQVASGYNSRLKAGQIINLLPGFTVHNGSTFSIQIETCDE